MKRSGLFFLILLFSTTGLAQNTNSLSGTVVDAKTNEPIPFANVFLAHTLFGASTKADGTFLLEKIPSGKYNVTASMVGYKVFSIPVPFSDGPVKIKIRLVQETVQLQEVVVKPGRSDFDRYYSTFKKYFLGQTPNSNRCTIMNPGDIYIDYDEGTKVLKASASQPIKVENPALGYTVFYLLSEFKLDYRANIVKVLGVPRFERLISKKVGQERHWLQNRDKAYYGSVNHFMRSFLSRELKQNHFSIVELKPETDVVLDERTLFLHCENQVFFKGKMKVIFDGAPEELTYSMLRNFRPQTSRIDFNEDSFTIYENGYYENLEGIVLNGYFAWRECIGNLLPINYQPAKKK